MRAKRMKSILTVVLTTALVFGSTITAFAVDGESEGTGSYEGGEMKYPNPQVTLPTIPAGTYDYIADPNGLIAATSAAHYGGATFTGTSGIFFKTKDAVGDTKAEYTNKSKAQIASVVSAKDIDVTVKLEQKTAGSEGVAYSDTATYESTDKANKIYLAVTDDAETNAKVAALSSTTAAELTTVVEGKPDNYVEHYDPQTEKYGYVLKTPAEGEELEWNECSYTLTGALNTNATWGDEVTFPAIKVTWSWAEHSDDAAPSIATTEYTVDGTEDVAITVNLGGGTLAATGISGITFTSTTGATKTLEASLYSLQGTTLTIDKSQVSAWVGAGVASRTYTIKFNDEAETTKTITMKKSNG